MIKLFQISGHLAHYVKYTPASISLGHQTTSSFKCKNEKKFFKNRFDKIKVSLYNGILC